MALSISRTWAVIWLVTVPVMAAVTMVWLGRPVDPIIAEVVTPTVDQTGEGYVADVRWVDEEGVATVRELTLDQDHVTSGTVPVVVEGGEARAADQSDLEGASPLVVAGTAAVALLFAVVVLATVRGFGFVRGTGQPGEMKPEDVEESHGFYWRH